MAASWEATDLVTNMRHGRKWLIVTNALAYYNLVKMTTSFFRMKNVAGVIKSGSLIQPWCQYYKNLFLQQAAQDNLHNDIQHIDTQYR